LNRQLTKTAWANYLKDYQHTNGLTLAQDVIIPQAEWSEQMVEASQRRRAVTTYQNGKPVIAIPIVLRGEILGAMEIEAGDQVSEADTAEMVQAVSQRLAVSLDRARLFEEAQETTAQEQYINDIVARYQAAGSVDDLLRITLTELSQTLGAQRGAIRLGGVRSPESGNDQSGNGHQNGEGQL
jgi:GAF domain-containing protein